VLIAALLTFFGKHHNPVSFLFSSITSVNPLEASSADLAGGTLAPALVLGDVKMPSPLFALFPALQDLYQAAPFALVFAIGLLQAQWTYTGYDASAHVAEETVMARLNSAWGVFSPWPYPRSWATCCC
jgi:amino acid transporter